MHMLLLIGIGGFFGAILRYLMSGWIQNDVVAFPLGTLGVNFIGSFFLGLIMYLSEYKGIFNEDTRIFLTVGVLGAFTTMSTFSYESFKLLEQKEMLLLTINVVSTILLTFAGIYLGKFIAVDIWRV
ncbi:MAG: fluoride efflux transporter CrcB [Waddliaceae bacterium]|jgi:fluoride exporter|nr:fluoride efflux transporter CrcB [Waddliaceae bacterium]MBT3578752.1 fluoride efflux transporter CrcB [Waddliaceae bacterium]MBT4445060.1 fluoride efflux transporter CrcB [Waddliaceae bacterium]MBT6929087.1 fluoride efflux transporter CrcB [Waddliaceae bacterium]MBT7264373.1 fluoride efflux transporter CrcB [Waddliaceae bacterium]